MTAQWGFLAKVNYCKNGSIYPVLTWSQFRPDMHQAFMVHGDYTKYDQALTKAYSLHDLRSVGISNS